MTPDLIFDVGSNNGDDTDFYLKKGFRVVAIDADASLCEQVTKRFRQEVDRGQLTVVHGLVSDSGLGTETFYLFVDNPGWNTADLEFKNRMEAAGHATRKVEVPVIGMDHLLARHGVPHYLKIDIEGNDLKALCGLEEFSKAHSDRPSYVSTEMVREDVRLAMQQLLTLERCGYSRFQFVNQGMRMHVRAPDPPREGRYARFRHDQITTGLFGRELDGKWLDIHGAASRIATICRLNWLYQHDPRFSKDGKFSGTLWAKIHNRFRRHVLGDPINGIDLHAAL
jgi:FkbM family methyltransferase